MMRTILVSVGVAVSLVAAGFLSHPHHTLSLGAAFVAGCGVGYLILPVRKP